MRGELDAVTADGFAVEAVRLLKRVDGPVAVDLSILDFMDCAGARTLAAVLDTIPSWRLVDVSGIRPPVKRLLDLMGLDLAGRCLALPPGRELALSPRGQEVISQAHTALWHSRAMMLETSAVMARLAATYAEMAYARERRATREDAKAERMQALSDTARDLSARYRRSS